MKNSTVDLVNNQQQITYSISLISSNCSFKPLKDSEITSSILESKHSSVTDSECEDGKDEII